MTPDIPVTVAIAVLCTIGVLAAPRRWALVFLGIPMVAHPCVLLLPPPQLALTPTRFVAICLILRCLLSKEIRSLFRWRIVDTCAIFYYAMITISMLIASPNFGVALNNRVGFFLSAMLPYFCARFLLTDREALYSFLRGMLCIVGPLGVLGLYEMISSYNPWDNIRMYGFMKLPRKGDGWRIFMGTLRARARGPFAQYIIFGWLFAVFVAVGTNLFFRKMRIGPWTALWLCLPLGIIGSIASGPMTLAVMSCVILLLFPLRNYWRVGVGIIFAGYAAALGYSNRSFFQIIGSMGFNGHSSWYRYALVRHVTETRAMSGHWIAGYGEIPPSWGQYHDLCIHWVWLLAMHGLMGIVGFYSLITAICVDMFRARHKAKSLEDQWLLWSFMALMFSSLAAMLVTALFSEMMYVWHLIMGMLANGSVIVAASNSSNPPPQAEGRQVGVLAQVDGKKVLLRYTLAPGQKLAIVRNNGDAVVTKPLEEKSGTVKVDT